MNLKPIPAMVLCLSMSGCATLTNLTSRFSSPKISSYAIPEVSDADADEVTSDMAAFLAEQLPPAKTTIELDPVRSDLHDMLLEHLTGKGFGVIETQPEGEHQAVSLRYAVTRFERGVLVRMKFQGKEASRFYARANSGGLSFHNAYAVREISK